MGCQMVQWGSLRLILSPSLHLSHSVILVCQPVRELGVLSSVILKYVRQLLIKDTKMIHRMIGEIIGLVTENSSIMIIMMMKKLSLCEFLLLFFQ